MKIAIVGSRGLTVENLSDFLPAGVTEIVSDGARGVDACARTYARAHDLRLTEFLPDYRRFGRVAPLKRNEQIVAYSDAVIAFWDGRSRGTRHVIDLCCRNGKTVTVVLRPLP